MIVVEISMASSSLLNPASQSMWKTYKSHAVIGFRV